MELVDDLGNDVALAILVEKRLSKSIKSEEILPLIGRIREVLEPISSKDDSYENESADLGNFLTNSH